MGGGIALQPSQQTLRAEISIRSRVKLISSHTNAMVGLEYEMTHREMIDGPLPSTKGSPSGERLCWQIVAGSLVGPRINARIASPGTDWMRVGPDGVRRQDLRAQLVTDDDVTILLHYDTGLIRAGDGFLRALQVGAETTWSDQYMRIVPEFIVGCEKYAWLNRSLFLGEGRLSGGAIKLSIPSTGFYR